MEAAMPDHNNKWNIPGWGAAQGQIREAMHFLFKGKTGTERDVIAEELVALVRSIGRGGRPEIQSSPFDREEHAREGWARMVSNHIVNGALAAVERSSAADQVCLLREIVRLALWHMPNAVDEARNAMKYLEIETLKQPHPRDDPAPEI
jgi:hypothetical protein